MFQIFLLILNLLILILVTLPRLIISVEIEPGTPFSITDSGDQSRKSVTDHTDMDHATSVPVCPVTSTPNISVYNVVTSESLYLKKMKAWKVVVINF